MQLGYQRHLNDDGKRRLATTPSRRRLGDGLSVKTTGGQDNAVQDCCVVKTGGAKQRAMPDGIVEWEPAPAMDTGSDRVEHPSGQKKDEDWLIESG
jgi:hypothetical protein